MFTGIIEDIGRVKSVEKKGGSGRIRIAVALDLSGTSVGGSVAVDGACLTVVDIGKNEFSADVSEETLTLTTLAGKKAGDTVNIERAMTLNKPLGGHLVTGHVDGVGTIVNKVLKSGHLDIEIKIPSGLMGHIVKKGSIAIDGISLTIADFSQDSFRAAVIPHTLEKTTLSSKKNGGHVNVETDLLGKYVERYFQRKQGGNVTEGFLAEHGFLTRNSSS